MALVVGRWPGRPGPGASRPEKRRSGPVASAGWPCGILVACRSVEACVEAWTGVRRQRKAPVKAVQLMQKCSQTAAQSGRWVMAMEVLERARVWKIPLQLDTYKHILRACERGAQDRAAVTVLEHLSESGLPADTETYRTAIAAVLAAWQLPRGRLTRSRMSQPVDEGELCEIVEEMWEAAVEDSERRAALEATASTGLLARSLQAFEAVEQDSKAFCSLLRCAGVAEAPRAIELILQEALWRFGPEPELYRAALLAFKEAKADAELLSLLEALRGQSIRLDPKMCEAAVESHLKLQRPGVRGLLEEAYAWLQQDQTPEGLAAMVRSLAFAEEWQTSLQYLEHLRKQQRPDGITMNAVIRGCYRGGNTQLALELFKEAEDLHLDALSYHIAMLGLTEGGESRAAFELYKAAKAEGLCPQWINRKSWITVEALEEELALVAVKILLQQVLQSTTPPREVCITVAEATTRDSSEVKEMKRRLALLLSEYGLKGDHSNAGEVRVSRLELKQFLGRMRERRAKTTRDQTALDTCWKAPERAPGKS